MDKDSLCRILFYEGHRCVSYRLGQRSQDTTFTGGNEFGQGGHSHHVILRRPFHSRLFFGDQIYRLGVMVPVLYHWCRSEPPESLS